MEQRYEVWRYHKLVGVFTINELKNWMLHHLPARYVDEIQAATVAYDPEYKSRSLDWIATCSGYCSIEPLDS